MSGNFFTPPPSPSRQQFLGKKLIGDWNVLCLISNNQPPPSLDPSVTGPHRGRCSFVVLFKLDPSTSLKRGNERRIIVFPSLLSIHIWTWNFEKETDCMWNGIRHTRILRTLVNSHAAWIPFDWFQLQTNGTIIRIYPVSGRSLEVVGVWGVTLPLLKTSWWQNNGFVAKLFSLSAN
jgi:hypothetical protein